MTLPLRGDLKAVDRIVGYLRNEAPHYPTDTYNALWRVAEEIETREILPGEDPKVDRSPKVETRLYLVEYSKSIYVMAEIKVDGILIGSHPVVSTATACSPGERGYERHLVRVELIKSFFQGGITLEALREELF